MIVLLLYPVSIQDQCRVIGSTASGKCGCSGCDCSFNATGINDLTPRVPANLCVYQVRNLSRTVFSYTVNTLSCFSQNTHVVEPLNKGHVGDNINSFVQYRLSSFGVSICMY